LGYPATPRAWLLRLLGRRLPWIIGSYTAHSLAFGLKIEINLAFVLWAIKINLIKGLTRRMEVNLEPHTSPVLIPTLSVFPIEFDGLLEMDRIVVTEAAPFGIAMERTIITRGPRRFWVPVCFHPFHTMGTPHFLFYQWPTVLNPGMAWLLHTLHFVVRNPNPLGYGDFLLRFCNSATAFNFFNYGADLIIHRASSSHRGDPFAVV
jgi:hypothetical protein